MKSGVYPLPTLLSIECLIKKGDGSVARRCSITGKGVMTGNNVSHANNKNKDGLYRTSRRFRSLAKPLVKR